MVKIHMPHNSEIGSHIKNNKRCGQQRIEPSISNIMKQDFQPLEVYMYT